MWRRIGALRDCGATFVIRNEAGLRTAGVSAETFSGVPGKLTRRASPPGSWSTGADRGVERIHVRPDAFCTNLFRDLLASGSPDDPGREQIETALARTLESPYEAWREERALPTSGR